MIKVAAAPAGAMIDDKFLVWVRQGEEEWQQLSVYVALTPNGVSNWIKIPEEIKLDIEPDGDILDICPAGGSCMCSDRDDTCVPCEGGRTWYFQPFRTLLRCTGEVSSTGAACGLSI